eukprot:3126223-Prorocentrum_lima.AAC.1
MLAVKWHTCKDRWYNGPGAEFRAGSVVCGAHEWSYLNLPDHLKTLLEQGTAPPMRETKAATSSG